MVMKMLRIFLLAGSALALAGCASSDVGGTGDAYDSGASLKQSNHPDSPPPTFRPGMNPDDIRDPNAFAYPRPGGPPPPP